MFEGRLDCSPEFEELFASLICYVCSFLITASLITASLIIASLNMLSKGSHKYQALLCLQRDVHKCTVHAVWKEED